MAGHLPPWEMVPLHTANLGDALMYSLAEHLRDSNEGNGRRLELGQRSHDQFIEAEIITGELTDKMVKFVDENPEHRHNLDWMPIDDEWQREMVKASLKRLSASLDYIDAKKDQKPFRNTDELLKWPVGSLIRVENISNWKAIRKLRKDQTLGASMDSVEGRLLTFSPSHWGGLLRLQTKFRKKTVEVHPLIDPGREYLPNVKVTFLDLPDQLS